MKTSTIGYSNNTYSIKIPYLLGTIYQHIVVLTQHWNMPMAASCETTITPLRASHTSQETILRVYAIVNGSFPFQYEIIINRAFQHGLIKPVLN